MTEILVDVLFWLSGFTGGIGVMVVIGAIRKSRAACEDEGQFRRVSVDLSGVEL